MNWYLNVEWSTCRTCIGSGVFNIPGAGTARLASGLISDDGVAEASKLKTRDVC